MWCWWYATCRAEEERDEAMLRAIVTQARLARLMNALGVLQRRRGDGEGDEPDNQHGGDGDTSSDSASDGSESA